MSTLPIIFNSNILNQDAIHARDLYQSLEVGKEFANWIKDRIERYKLVENQDYITLANSGKRENRGFAGFMAKKEYHLTVEVAKSIAMMENNRRGQEIRQYFISVETKAKQLLPELQQRVNLLTEKVLADNPIYDKIVRYSQLGLNQMEIAKLCNLNVNNTRKQQYALANLGLVDKPKKAVQSKINFTPEQLSDMHRRRMAGETYPQIAKCYGCSKQTIQNRLKQLVQQ